MPENTPDSQVDPSPGPTPAGYQRTTGGNYRWEPPPVEKLQSLLTGYDVIAIIGHGGMGAVYRARQRSLDRMVAIKLLPPEAVDEDDTFAERFKNEARTMAKMNHPGIVHVHDFGETSDGQLFIVMEFVEGTDVQRMLDEHRVLTPKYALPIAAHVCDALQYAHTHGVVHRDIKPANIMYTNEGQVKVADFGLARLDDPGSNALTQANMSMGTPDYVSPETLTIGMIVDHRADLYSLGVMLYHMLVGEVPRGAFDMPSKRKPGLDPRIDGIILRAMKQNRDERYQSAAEIRKDIDAILAAPLVKPEGKTGSARPRPVMAPPGSAKTRTVPVQVAAKHQPAATEAGSKPRSHRWIIPAGIAAVLILGGALVLRGQKKPAAKADASVASTSSVKPQSSGPIKVRDYKPAASPQATAGSSSSSTAPITVKAGEWNPVRWPGDKPPKGQWRDSALILPKREQCKLPSNYSGRDAAIRARVSNDSGDGSFKGIYFKLRNDNALGFFNLGKPDVVNVGAQPDFSKDMITLGDSAKGVVPLGKKALLVEFAAVGDDLVLALDGKVVVSAKTNAPGKVPPALGGRANAPFLALIQAGWNTATFAEIEFMPLDEVSADRHPDFIKQARSQVSPAPVPVTLAKAASAPIAPPSPAPIPAPVLMAAPPPAASKPPAAISAELAALQKQYATVIFERVTAPHDAEVAKLNASFIAGLDRAIGSASAVERLDFETDKNLIKAGKPLPALDDPDTPAALKSMRAIYRAKIAEIDEQRTTNHLGVLSPYISRLKQVETDLTKSGRIDDATAIKSYREALGENPFAMPAAR